MTEDSWEEVYEDEMGIREICDSQYGYITTTNCLDNLDGTSGAGANHSYVKRGHLL